MTVERDFMKKIILSLLVLSIFGCAQIDRQSPQEIGATGNVHAAMTGPEVVNLLTNLYNQTLQNCNNSVTAPAFLCSGVTLRVTDKQPGETHHVWNPARRPSKTVVFRFLT